LRAHTIQLRDLSGALRQAGEHAPQAFLRASLSAARRIQAAIVAEIDRRGITDLGALKASYRAHQTGDGAIVDSDCPYAGVVELGARPHPIGKAVRERIAAWGVRKLGLSESDAKRMAFFVGKKLATEGQKPTYVVRGVTKSAGAWLAEAMKYELEGM
jgi:hypothetical protein